MFLRDCSTIHQRTSLFFCLLSLLHRNICCCRADKQRQYLRLTNCVSQKANKNQTFSHWATSFKLKDFVIQRHKPTVKFRSSNTLLLLLLGAELPLVVESFGLLNDIFPFPSILDAGYPVFNLHLANILFDVILPSVLGSFL